MKREILFRGKRLDNGQWIEGYLFKIWDKAYILWGTVNGIPDQIEVVTDTVGQYIGLTDKIGNKIFEDDIVESTRCIAVDPEEGDKENCVVGWDDTIVCGFSIHIIRNGLKSSRSLSSYNGIREKDLTVIGNIHDNPDLLK